MPLGPVKHLHQRQQSVQRSTLVIPVTGMTKLSPHSRSITAQGKTLFSEVREVVCFPSAATENQTLPPSTFRVAQTKLGDCPPLPPFRPSYIRALPQGKILLLLHQPVVQSPDICLALIDPETLALQGTRVPPPLDVLQGKHTVVDYTADQDGALYLLEEYHSREGRWNSLRKVDADGVVQWERRGPLDARQIADGISLSGKFQQLCFDSHDKLWLVGAQQGYICELDPTQGEAKAIQRWDGKVHPLLSPQGKAHHVNLKDLTWHADTAPTGGVPLEGLAGEPGQHYLATDEEANLTLHRFRELSIYDAQGNLSWQHSFAPMLVDKKGMHTVVWSPKAQAIFVYSWDQEGKPSRRRRYRLSLSPKLQWECTLLEANHKHWILRVKNPDSRAARFFELTSTTLKPVSDPDHPRPFFEVQDEQPFAIGPEGRIFALYRSIYGLHVVRFTLE